MADTLEKLNKELEKVEKELKKWREKCATIYGNGTMRKAKAEVNWDYYANKKRNLLERIDRLK